MNLLHEPLPTYNGNIVAIDFKTRMLCNLILCDMQEFFISGGDGLPRGTVENLVARVRPVITLLSYEVLYLVSLSY